MKGIRSQPLESITGIFYEDQRACSSNLHKIYRSEDDEEHGMIMLFVKGE